MGVDGPQTVVPGMATALLDAAFAGGKVQLVMKHRDIGKGQLVKRHRPLHRLTGRVHECFGFQQNDLFAAQPPLGHQPLERPFPRAKPVVGGNPVNGHETDVVAMPGVFRPRIAQTCE